MDTRQTGGNHREGTEQQKVGIFVGICQTDNLSEKRWKRIADKVRESWHFASFIKFIGFGNRCGLWKLRHSGGVGGVDEFGKVGGGISAIFANSATCELDAQGRILVPQELRKYAGIEKDVTIIGLPGRAELWDSGEYNRAEQAVFAEKSMAELYKELGL